MGTAVPSVFVSTGDLESARNTLEVIYENQVHLLDLIRHTLTDASIGGKRPVPQSRATERNSSK
jgi:hypothetical protein